MTVKLHINVAQGVIDVEGDSELVREVYADFKGRLLNQFERKNEVRQKETEEAKPAKAKPAVRKRATTKRRAKSDADVSTNGYDTRNPKIDNSLDTTGLAVFYNQFQPKNMSEKLLVLRSIS